MKFEYDGKRLLTVEETKRVATAKQKAWKIFQTALLEIEDCRDALLMTWADHVAAGRAVTKLSEDFACTHMTPKQIRDILSDNLNRAIDVEEMSEKIAYILKANIATTVYEDLYREMGAWRWPKVKQRYEEYLELRNILLAANLRLVPRFVLPYVRRGVDFDDLVQEGRLGLVRAVEKYDPDRGIRFSSYASWWIKQGIRKAIKNDRRAVRLPHHVYDYASKVTRQSATFRMQHRRDPTLKELVALTGFSREKIEGLAGVMSDLISLERPTKVRREDLEAIEEEPQRRVEETVLTNQLDSIMDKILTPVEAAIVRQHYGINTPESPLSKIATNVKLSQERVRQLELRALTKLKNYLKEV